MECENARHTDTQKGITNKTTKQQQPLPNKIYKPTTQIHENGKHETD